MSGTGWWSRHPKKWLIGVLAAATAAVVGGPSAYVHFVEGKPPPAFSLSPGSAGAAARRRRGAPRR